VDVGDFDAAAERQGGVRLIWQLARVYRPALAVGLLLGVLASVAALAQPLITRDVLDSIARETTVWTPVAWLIGLVLVGAVLSGIQVIVLERAGERLVLGLRTGLIARLLRLRMREYDTRPLGDLLSRAGSDTTLLRSVVTANVFDALVSLLRVAGAIVLMAYLDWVQLVVVLVVLAVVSFGVAPALRRIKIATVAAQASVGDMTSSLERALGAIRTVKASVAEDREAARIGERARAAYDAGVRAAKLDAVVGVGSGLAAQLSFLIVLGVGGARVAAGVLSTADLIAFLLYMMYLAAPVMVISRSLSQLQKASAAAARITAVNAMDVEIDTPNTVVGATVVDRHGNPAPVTAVDRPSPGEVTIEACPSVTFDRVSFEYRDSVPVLQGASFCLDAGAQAALVGPSGAGKSTIFALLERFYEPDSGQIRLGDRDLVTIPRDELRRQIGYVEQDAPVLAGTLRENLLYLAPDGGCQDLDAVVRASRLEDLVSRLPDGLDTEVGDHGVQLSGGERQRVAIGRLLLRRPKLVLLDEATSQLDAVNEQALRAAIANLASGCTMLVIAHRLATVAASDQIVLLEQGTVRRVGGHEELIAEDTLYRSLAHGQLITMK
jgi:ABC-type multidrug transport system fused ATPase/permease subunit